MKTIKYTVEITGIDNKGKQIKINVMSSSAQELLKDLKAILDKESKTWIEKILGLIK